jgi:hypothetical protein
MRNTSSSITVAGRELAQVLNMTWPLADQEGRAPLGLDFVHLRVTGGLLIASATDRFVAGWARCSCSAADASWEVLIGREDAQEIAQELSDRIDYSGDNVTVSLDEKGLLIQSAEQVWRARGGRSLSLWPRNPMARIAQQLLQPTPWDGPGFAAGSAQLARLTSLPTTRFFVVTPVVMHPGGPLIRITTDNFVGGYVGAALNTMTTPRTYWQDLTDPDTCAPILADLDSAPLEAVGS